ncbi:MAG: DUF1580 domain-containing protein [Planctomycetota bacterium]
MLSDNKKWLTPNQITEIIPSRMRGRNISQQSVRRWQLKGIQGVYLKSALVGGVRCSTEEDVESFVKELTERDYNRRFYTCNNTPPLTGLNKTRRHEAAESEARNLGI